MFPIQFPCNRWWDTYLLMEIHQVLEENKVIWIRICLYISRCKCQWDTHIRTQWWCSNQCMDRDNRQHHSHSTFRDSTFISRDKKKRRIMNTIRKNNGTNRTKRVIWLHWKRNRHNRLWMNSKHIHFRNYD